MYIYICDYSELPYKFKDYTLIFKCSYCLKSVNNDFLAGKYMFNKYLASIPILDPLKTPENQRFSGVFRRYETRVLAKNRSKLSIEIINWRV